MGVQQSDKRRKNIDPNVSLAKYQMKLNASEVVVTIMEISLSVWLNCMER